jgi:hypothetical protein
MGQSLMMTPQRPISIILPWHCYKKGDTTTHLPLAIERSQSRNTLEVPGYPHLER